METREDAVLIALLDVAEAEALALVSRIEWVNYLERKDNSFAASASARAREPAAAEAIRGVLRGICAKTRADSWMLRCMDAWPDLLPQELVTCAVKAWVRAELAGSAWLAKVRFMVKFEGIDRPYVQEVKQSLESIRRMQGLTN